jgi:hypothetical protein
MLAAHKAITTLAESGAEDEEDARRNYPWGHSADWLARIGED